MPGGIKLCSPGTFLVANYLIINNGSCQVNFTKPNMVTIRYTNSQRLREDATEVAVGRVAVPKVRYKTFRHAEMPLEYLWARSPCRRAVRSLPSPRDNLYPMCASRFPCARDHTPLVVFRCPLPSIFMKFTWHPNLHYRYL